jgi:hypothetical protein
MNRCFATLAIVTIALVGTTFADEDRPCGSEKATGIMRYIVPQGAGGADFKPACRSHDRCYETPCADKAACDRAFLRDMQAACNCADRPIKCRITARIMYFAVKVGGRKAYEEAQAQARHGR